MASDATFLVDFYQDHVGIAIELDVDDFLAMAGLFAFAPQTLPRT
jgi:hypothetical protein